MPAVEMARALARAEIRERLTSIGFHIVPTTPGEHEKNLRSGRFQGSPRCGPPAR